MAEGRSHDSIMTAALVGMSNNIDPQIRFTGEGADNHVGGRVPMLDLEVWRSSSKETGGKKLEWSYYEKPIMSQLLLMEKSAMPMNTKMNVLSQEIIRRMKNMSLSLPVSARVEVLNRMMIKMKDSGYSQDQRLDVLHAGTLGFCRMMVRQRTMGRRINRPRKEGQEERRDRKILGDTQWFRHKSKEELPDLDMTSRKDDPARNNRRKKTHRRGVRQSQCEWRNRGGEGESRTDLEKEPVTSRKSNPPPPLQQPETMVFVPITDKSTLKKKLQEQDDKFASLHNTSRVRFVERGGGRLLKLWGQQTPGEGFIVGEMTVYPALTPLKMRNWQPPKEHAQKKGAYMH